MNPIRTKKPGTIAVRSAALAVVLIVGPDLSFADPGEVGFTVGEPEVMHNFTEIMERELRTDCPISAVNDQGTWKFFSWFHGFKYAIGTRERPFGEMKIVHGPLRGAPDPRVLKFDVPPDGTQSLLHEYAEGLPGGLKIGNARYQGDSGASNFWLSNVWRIPESGNLLGFYHVEQLHPDCLPNVPPLSAYVYFVLGISKDGGKSWEYCGRIMEHDSRYDYDWFLENKQTHLTGMPCVVRNGEYLQIYYVDFAPVADGRKRIGTAVMRVRIEDLVQEAEKEKPAAAPWSKYHEGEWTEPGLGGRWTSLGLPMEGSLHGDAAYNAYLDCYMIVTHSHTKRGRILLSFSRDGLRWSKWHPVISATDHDRRYASIVSMGEDNEVTGKSFWIYYKKYNRSLDNSIQGAGYDFERVKFTLAGDR